MGNGNGTFQLAATSPAVGTNPDSIVVGNFGNGHIDLAVANQGSNNVSILLGNGDGTFQAASGSPYTVGTNPESIVAGYFNGLAILWIWPLLISGATPSLFSQAAAMGRSQQMALTPRRRPVVARGRRVLRQQCPENRAGRSHRLDHRDRCDGGRRTKCRHLHGPSLEHICRQLLGRRNDPFPGWLAHDRHGDRFLVLAGVRGVFLCPAI